jgi:hypothetical protein
LNVNNLPGLNPFGFPPGSPVNAPPGSPHRVRPAEQPPGAPRRGLMPQHARGNAGAVGAPAILQLAQGGLPLAQGGLPLAGLGAQPMGLINGMPDPLLGVLARLPRVNVGVPGLRLAQPVMAPATPPAGGGGQGLQVRPFWPEAPLQGLFHAPRHRRLEAEFNAIARADEQQREMAALAPSTPQPTDSRTDRLR